MEYVHHKKNKQQFHILNFDTTLPANNIAIVKAPVDITDGSPDSIDIDLDATFKVVTHVLVSSVVVSDQTDLGRGRRTVVDCHVCVHV